MMLCCVIWPRRHTVRSPHTFGLADYPVPRIKNSHFTLALYLLATRTSQITHTPSIQWYNNITHSKKIHIHINGQRNRPPCPVADNGDNVLCSADVRVICVIHQTPYPWGMTNYPIGPHRNQIGPNRTQSDHSTPYWSTLDLMWSDVYCFISCVLNVSILLCVKQQIKFSKCHLK